MALARDSHLEVVPLLNEEPASYTFSHLFDHFETGAVAGELQQPADREVRVLHFDGISNNEAVVPATSLRRLLDYYAGGGELRVYRLWPAVGSAWSESNVYGYSNMVPESTSRIDYPYYTPAMTSFSFKLEGLEV